VKLYRLFLDAGYDVNTYTAKFPGMTILTYNLVRSCDQPQKRLEIAKLLVEKGADIYIPGALHVNFLHQLAFAGSKTVDCVAPILKALGADNVWNEVYMTLYWKDDSGTTPIDYSMSTWDPQRGNNCMRFARDERYSNYRFAEYLASLNPDVAKEFEAKKKNWQPGTLFRCSLAEQMNYLAQPN
jgi:hypothetical protein